MGTTITITGSSFDGTALAAVNTVYFGCSNGSATCAGGVTAKPISVSRTEIKVQVPVGATTGFVQVSAPTTGKTSYSNYSSQPFTVEASVPAPTIAKLSANSGVVGQSVTIIGADFTQDATVKFGCAAKSCPGSAKGAVVTFVNPQEIQAEIPKGAVGGYLQVATASGTAYSPNSFTVNTPSITSIDPTAGTVGSPVAINGSFFAGTTLVTFAGGADGKGVSVDQSGFEVINGSDKVSQILVSAIPTGAQTGTIQVTTPNGLLTSKTWTNVGQPTITSIAPTTGKIGSQVTITGTKFTNANGDPVVVQNVQFTSLGTPDSKGTAPEILVPAEFFEVVSDTQIIATVPDKATTGPVTVTTSGGIGTGAKYTVVVDKYPALPTWVNSSGTATSIGVPLTAFRGYISTSIADTLAKPLPSSGPAGRCVSDGCPIPEGESTPSVANTVGEYGFNIVYALMGKPTTDAKLPDWYRAVANPVVQLATQPNVLTFISETVAQGTTPLGLTLGNAVATFVQKSFGNADLAAKFAPFLGTLNLPNQVLPALDFLTNVSKDGVNAALLSTFKPAQAQQALIKFFKDPVVQGVLKDATTSAVKVLLGLQSPDWEGAPQPPTNAVADYLGQLGAVKLLGDGNPYSSALGDTISGTITRLFSSIGETVAVGAGTALVTFLNWTAPSGQQDVPTILANTMVNGLFQALQTPCTDCKPLPFPDQPPLLPSLAPAAGAAVTGFVGSLLSDSSVLQGVGTFVTDLVPGVLGNQGVQDDIEAQVSDSVSRFLGDDLGAVVGPKVGAAVVDLVTDTTVSTALTTFVNTAFGDFLGSSGVVSALADAAGTLATAQLDGTIKDVLPKVEQALRTNPAIDIGVNAGVTAAMAGLLGDMPLWSAVDGVVSSLVGGLLADVQVQSVLADTVAQLVSAQLEKKK
ncbi:MAG: IPT/TIG domain-containing protein, partial [Mycobacterium sp.]|nr:IPT/TIG domain-containing protein [Mycobacterium sp.]